MKKYICIAAMTILLASCSSSTFGPITKSGYMEKTREFYDKVEDNKDSIDKDLWEDMKKENDKIVGERFSKFKGQLVSKEIIFIGEQNYKFQQYYKDYKRNYKAWEERQRNNADSTSVGM